MKKVKFVRKEVLVKKNHIEDAMDTLGKALKTDKGYHVGWRANLAMAIKDNSDLSLKKSNEIASIILKGFFDA